MGDVLVTGAAGFIGGHTVQYLSRECGLPVVASTRDGRNGTRRLDVQDPASMAAALAGVDAVVHCAVGGRAVTVDGTRALLRAAAEAGVRRVVHLSSNAVYGGAIGILAEDTAMVPAEGDGYPAWKAAAELACLAETGVETVRLRPTIVYGPGGMLWVGQFARRIRSGRWGVLGPAGEGTCNPVHVSDVASAIAAAVSAPGAAGQAFNVNGPDTTTWNGWFVKLAEVMGAPPLRTLSPAVLQARLYAALPVKAVARLRLGFGRNWLLGAPRRNELDLFAHRVGYSIEAARKAMGWTPSVPIAAGLAGTVEWLRTEGLAD